MRISRTLISLLCLLQIAVVPVQAKSADFDDDAIEQTDFLADALKIQKQRAEFLLLKGKHDSANMLRLVYLQNRMTHRLLVDFFEINSTVAELADEIEDTDHQISLIERKRYREMQLANIANFGTTGTLGVIGTSFGLPSNSSPTIPALFGLVGASTSIGLSAFTLWLERMGHTKTVCGAPNMLTYVFYPDSHEPTYPLPVVVKDYLHRKSEQKTDTRAHNLIAGWKRTGLMHNCSDKEIAEVCQLQPGNTTLAVLHARSAMLRSLRTSLVQTNKGLMKLAEEVDDELNFD